MTNLSTCEVLDKVNNEYITLCIESLESSLKVIVLKKGQGPKVGEVTMEDAERIKKGPDKSSEECLKDIGDALSGRQSDIEFYLRSNILELKRNKIWSFIKISVYPVIDERDLANILLKLLERHKTLEIQSDECKKENERLKKDQTLLTKNLEEIIEIKNCIEQSLYTKFLLVLNTKKEKIRELKSKLKAQSDGKSSVYDYDTDEEEEDCEVAGKAEAESNAKPNRLPTRPIVYNSDEESMPKRSKKVKLDVDRISIRNDKLEPKLSTSNNFVEKNSVNSINHAEPEPSTSRKNSSSPTCKEMNDSIDKSKFEPSVESNIPAGDELTRHSLSPTLSEENESDIVLKFESQDTDPFFTTRSLYSSEAESEEDMFSL